MAVSQKLKIELLFDQQLRSWVYTEKNCMQVIKEFFVYPYL